LSSKILTGSLRITERDRIMSNPNPPAPPAPVPRWFIRAGLIALAVYAVFLVRYTTVAAGGADSSGYLNSARLLAHGHLQWKQRIPAEFGPPSALNRAHFTPHGFFPLTDPVVLPPTYPPGLPLHFALGGKLLGWDVGPRLIEVGAALAAVWLMWLLARELGLNHWLAAAGAVALGACPVFLFASIQPLSDTLATAWCAAAVLAALRARRAHRWAFACGLAFAIAVLVRPTNVVLAPALLVLLGFAWRRLALFAAAGLPGALWLGYYNNTLYGSALKSGYGDWRLSFATSYFVPTMQHFAYWLVRLLPAGLLVFTVAAFVRRETRTRETLALVLWFAAVTGLYACYQVSHEVWWCLRFILPALPALILLSLLGFAALAARWPEQRRARFQLIGALVFAGWAAAASRYWTSNLGLLWTKQYEDVYATACLDARVKLPPQSLVVTFYASGAIYYYTDFPILRWDLMGAPDFVHYATLAKNAGRPIYALIFEAEEKDALHERCPGEWTRIGTVRNIGLWQLAALRGPAQ
jgi:hypothetical protein